MNNVSLIGRLTKDPEVRLAGEDTKVCNFTLAVNRPYKDAPTDFIQCQAWKQQADFIGTYLKKGQLIAVTGSVQTRTYEKDGVTHYVTEINVNGVESLEKRVTSEQEIRDKWTNDWNTKSVGLDAKAKAILKKDLEKIYQPQIDKIKASPIEEDLPF